MQGIHLPTASGVSVAWSVESSSVKQLNHIVLGQGNLGTSCIECLL